LDDRSNLKNEIKSLSQRHFRGDRSHNLTIEGRKRMVLTGILNVESFNELEIVVETELGVLSIKGNSLHMSKLNLETGDLAIDGSIDSCTYKEKQDFKTKGKGILNKLFK